MAGIILGEASKEIAKPVLRRLMDRGIKIIDGLKADFSIEGQEVSFQCPENTQKWGIVFRSKKGLLSGKKDFPLQSLKKVSVQSLIPFKDVTDNCVKPLSSGGFELHYTRLNQGIPHLLNVELNIEEPRFIDNIVYRKVQDDTPNPEIKKYWMHAQLKFTDVFEKMFSDVRLEDIDFDVRVSTHEDINTSVPGSFRRELEVTVNWMNETDPEKKAFWNREHLRILRARRGGSSKGQSGILHLIQELQDIFMPRVFRTFIDVRKDFYYHDALRGIDFYTAPFPTWPKFMTVVTRTTLNLNKPAAEGSLEFNHKDFKTKINDLFEQYKIK